MAKEPQELKWVEDLLPEEDIRRKAMFGGFAYYLGEKMILAIFENPGDNSYRSQTYPFEVWNGCMFPVEREHHAKALQKFPFLVNHPVLPKWLYLPLKTEGFDEMLTEVLQQVLRPHSFWGSIPKGKSKKAAKVVAEKDFKKIDTRKPRMFSDEPAENKLQQAKKISDLKNLGPVSEREFRKAGIKTPAQFIKLGWKKTLHKLVQVNPKNRHSIFTYALIGALTNKEWNRISEEEKREARDFTKSLAVKSRQAGKRKLKKTKARP